MYTARTDIKSCLGPTAHC